MHVWAQLCSICARIYTNCAQMCTHMCTLVHNCAQTVHTKLGIIYEQFVHNCVQFWAQLCTNCAHTLVHKCAQLVHICGQTVHTKLCTIGALVHNLCLILQNLGTAVLQTVHTKLGTIVTICARFRLVCTIVFKLCTICVHN